MFRPVFILGTRPEAIKLAPVIHQCLNEPSLIKPLVWVTAQHRELLDLAMADFHLRSDLDLDLMRPGQSPLGLLGRCLEKLEEALTEMIPHCIVVQGDTTSALAGALAGFHRRIPVVHVEAGLRTGNLQRPFPEEFNRRTLTLAATMHCAPTTSAANELLREGVKSENVRVTGNTVIDALRWMLKQPRSAVLSVEGKVIASDSPLVLVTMHRRENFGDGVAQVLQAVAKLLERFPGVMFVWPVHRNPQVQEVVLSTIQSRSNLILTGPLPYSVFAPLLARTSVILTDSGGIQEEACYLRTPTVIMRNETERPEAVETNSAEVVGTDADLIVERISALLRSPLSQRSPFTDYAKCPFGDGHAAEKIVSWMSERFARH